MPNTFQKSCVHYKCAPGNFLAEDLETSCIPFLPTASNLGYILAVAINASINVEHDVTIGDVIEPLRELLTDALIGFDHRDSVKYTHIVVMEPCANIIQSNTTFKVHISLQITFLVKKSVQRRDLEYELINATSNDISIANGHLEIEGNVSPDPKAFLLPANRYRTQFITNCFMFNQEQQEHTSRAYKLSPISKALRCPQVILSRERYIYDELKQTLILLPSRFLLTFGDFQMVSKESAAVYLDDFEKNNSNINESTVSALGFVLGIVTLTCVSLSMLCLLMAFITYLVFPILQTLPGKNNMCLIFALFLSQGLTQFGLTRTADRLACTIIGILIHYFWLVTFFCMNVCSFHVFKVFAFSFHRPLDLTEERWYLFRYICYAYGVPAGIIILHTTISLPLSGYIGYGSNVRCFIENPQAIIGSFLAPIILLCVLNATFFSISAYKIKTSPKVASTNASRNEFSIYLKLFLLTGFTWVAQIIESFLPLSVFSVFVAILNGSSGMFIFFSYTMNERVRTFYRNSFSRKFTSFSSMSMVYSSKKDQHSESIPEIRYKKKAIDSDC